MQDIWQQNVVLELRQLVQVTLATLGSATVLSHPSFSRISALAVENPNY